MKGHRLNDPKVSNLPKKIGIVGLSALSENLVRKLIKSSHTVNIWDIKRQKCDRFQADVKKKLVNEFEGNLKTYLSARAVMKNSDIVFHCVSDQYNSTNLVINKFGTHNAADVIFRGKGYVEMTSVDPKTSREISCMVEMKGGKYLEAQVQSGGSAKEGSIVLAAGNKSLFDEFEFCFEAIAEHVLYYGGVGYATSLNLILQQMKAVCLAALSEALSLAHRCGVQQDDFLEILRSIPGISSRYLLSKADIVARKAFTDVQQSLNDMQKDLYLGLNLPFEGVGQSMFLGSVVSEILKRCQRNGYGDHDVAAVCWNQHQ